MALVEIRDAEPQLEELIERGAAGEQILLARDGAAAARIVPVTSMSAIRGAWRGRVRIADDFDELPDDIAEAFGMR
jgi:antitoxin (DNA-binding transcriptional repressor) of toxin-antitoxin stability system